MTYEKPSQAAKRLGVTSRTIQKWAADGRIPNAYKMADQWMIPADFTTPTAKNTVTPGAMLGPLRPPATLLNSTFRPGTCLDHIRSLSDEDERNIAYAEYCYFTGLVEEAVRIATPYLESKNPTHRHTACLVCIFSNLSRGHLHLARFALALLEESLAADPGTAKIPQVYSLRVWVAHAASMLLDWPLPEGTEPLEDWIRYLPGGMKLFACFLIAYELCQLNKYQGAHAVAKIAVALPEQQYVLPKIYCKLIDVIAQVNMKNIKAAETQFMAAWNLAQADGFIEPFAEQYLSMQGIVDRCLKNSYPEDYKRITESAAVFAKSWRKMHRSDEEPHFADKLSITEFAIAMMYTRSWSAKEIAAHLDMSVRTVYRHISNIYTTLGITNVAELREYMVN